MKQFFSLILAMSAVSAMAQDNYNLLGVSAHQTHFNTKDEWNNSDSGSMLGFGVNYLHGFRLMQNAPLYLETGAGMRFLFYSDHSVSMTGTHETQWNPEREHREKIQMVTMTVPLNLAYKFDINRDFSITPFAGLDVKAHLSGWSKEINTENGKTSTERTNLFNGDKYNMDGMPWTRFQTGWNAGIRLTYRHAFASASYGTDFAKLSNHKNNRMNTQNICVSFGYQF